MPNLIGIANIINTALRAAPFSTQKFQGGDWNAIAEQVKEAASGEQGEITRPVIISEDGDGKDVSVNDTYPLVVYHRVTNLEYEEPQEFNFGDPGMFKREIASMRIVFFGDRARLKVTKEDIAAVLALEIPDVLTAAQLQTLQLLDCQIEIEQAITDPYELWEQEYQGVAFNLKPNSIFVAVPYKIITEYNANCFSVCVN